MKSPFTGARRGDGRWFRKVEKIEQPAAGLADTRGMTQPRMRIAGATVQVTRTVDERRFLLVPERLVNQVVLYCFFLAAQRHGALVHVLAVERTHYHAVLTDLKGELSQLMHYADWLISKCLLAHYRPLRPEEHLESIWAPASFNETKLVNHAAIYNAVEYCVTNFVKDGLCYSYDRWPGVCIAPRDWLKPPQVVERPKVYFGKRTRMPASVECRVEPPPQFADRAIEGLVADMNRMIADEESAQRAARRSQGLSIIGEKRLLREDPFDKPRAPRPRGKTEPSVAAGGDKQAFKRAKQAVRRFREIYRERYARLRALLAQKSAEARQVLFPFGTLLMHHRHGYGCEPSDVASWCLLARPP